MTMFEKMHIFNADMLGAKLQQYSIGHKWLQPGEQGLSQLH